MGQETNETNVPSASASRTAPKKYLWTKCRGCGGEIGVPSNWGEPTVKCPTCGQTVEVHGKVLYRPPVSSPQNVAPSPVQAFYQDDGRGFRPPASSPPNVAPAAEPPTLTQSPKKQAGGLWNDKGWGEVWFGVAAFLFLALVGGCVVVVAYWGHGKGPVSPAPRPRDKDFINSIGMKLALIPAGKFQMGFAEADATALSDEKPRHEVEISQPFFIGVFPVTKKQFAAFVEDDHYKTEAEEGGDLMTWRAPGLGHTDDDPVVCVSWNDAVKFCAWLSKKENKTYKLPTEAEWEYACRAGTETAYSFGDDPKALDDYAWYCHNSGNHIHPVGGKKANPWGLYDMHGNIWEWCEWYGEYKSGYFRDPVNVTEQDDCALRGGSFANDEWCCRAGSRSFGAPGYRSYIDGFRVVLRPPAGTP